MAAVNVSFPGNLAQVATANDLRSIPTSLIHSGTLYLVGGLEGVFSFDPGSAAADDAATVIRPFDRTPMQVGRWLKQASGLGAGATGPAGSTYTTLALLKAAPVSNRTYNLAAESGSDGGYVNGPFVYQTGDFTGRTDVVALDTVPLSTGALVRQGAASVATALPSVYATVKNVEDRLNQMESINAEGLGVRYDTSAGQQVAFTRALSEAARLKRKLVVTAPVKVDGPIILPAYFALAGIAPAQSVFSHLPGYTGAIFQLADGPITFGSIADIGMNGNGAAGEVGMDLTARPPANPADYQHGGLWSSTFDRMRMENIGGATLKMWGGTSGLLPEQFLTFRDITVYRGNSADSRCISMAGQNGQVFFIGNNEFDGHPSTTDTPGTSVVVGMLYYNAALDRYGDAVDATQDDGTMRSGWARVTGDNNGAYVVHFEGTTIQSSIRGMLFDNARSCSATKMYFEALKQAVTVQGDSNVSIGGLFQNAGALSASDGLGYLVSNSSSTVNFEETRITGRLDRTFIRPPASGIVSWRGVENVSMPLGVDVHTIPSDVVQQTSPAVGVLDLAAADKLFIGTSTGVPEDVNQITSRLPPGSICHIVVAAGSVIRLNPSAKLPITRTIVLRGGDSFSLLKNDIGAPPEFYSIVDMAVQPLVAFSKPTTGYYEKGERVRSIADKVAGSVTSEWECTVSGSPATFLALNVTAVAA